MIPKRIFTIWINDLNSVMPDSIKKCIETHKIEGYEHKLITGHDLDFYNEYRYLREAFLGKKWVKIADFLRMYYLFTEGGIYLDADVEMLPGKNFDEYLDNKMVVCEERNGIYSNAIVGAEAGHPLLKEYLRRVEENFRGDGDLTFEPGIRAFADLLWLQDERSERTKILSPDHFFERSDKSLGIHYFFNSWK